MKFAAISEAYDRIAESENTKYAVGAMQPVDPIYTQNTIEEGDRVQSQLNKSLNQSKYTAEFRYQGSVTNDTHVKVHSDLDLLVLHKFFYTIQHPGVASDPYKGDVFADLRNLRSASAKVLKSEFPAVDVDDKPGKCITMKGGSLRRKIDVVVSNWFDTVEYQQRPLEVLRGIQIFNSETNTRIENRPFLHNARIDARDKSLQGNVRRAARFLKNLKYDADTELKISSYDITSLAYCVPGEYMQAGHGQELLLVENVRRYLKFLLDNPNAMQSLKVPNGMRAIFCEEGASGDQLKALVKEVQDLVDDINKELAPSLRKFADTRINY
ncbi:MAG TPA: hypothetical protein VGG46_15745 [Terriglobales bacterium]